MPARSEQAESDGGLSIQSLASEPTLPRQSHAGVSDRSPLLLRLSKAGASINPRQTIALDDAEASRRRLVAAVFVWTL